jgi:hypothetical protein
MGGLIMPLVDERNLAAIPNFPLTGPLQFDKVPKPPGKPPLRAAL